MSTGDSGAELISEIQSEVGPVEQLELKNDTEEELITNLFKAGEWNEEDSALVRGALELAQSMHAGRMYKERPYIYHSLRVANRIVRYMHINDAATVAAALLHDVVEDHAPELVQDDTINDPILLQKAALGVVSDRFGGIVAARVAAVSNEPEPHGQKLTEEQKMDKYVAKIWDATSDFHTWAIKFSDWCENGLGLIHSELDPDSEQMRHYMQKYGGSVLGTYVYRYKQYRPLLTPKANDYVAAQLTLAFQRLALELPHRQPDPQTT